MYKRRVEAQKLFKGAIRIYVSSISKKGLFQRFMYMFGRVVIKGLGGFQRLKTGTFLLFFLYICNEIFYSNSLPYKGYIFDKYFVKFLLKNFENSVIGTSSPVTLQKKVLSA